jgi:hypothetical protein
MHRAEGHIIAHTISICTCTAKRGTSLHTQLAFASTVHINELTLIPFKTQPHILESGFEMVKLGHSQLQRVE